MKINKISISCLVMLLIGLPTNTWSGSNYKLKYDRFTGTKTSTYDLSVGSECRLTATNAGELEFCTLQNSSNDPDDPNIMLITTSKTWDIMQYRYTGTYRDGKIPTIITYNDGQILNRSLGVKYQGDTISGRGVMEVVLVELGSVKDTIHKVKKIEVKYGSNEYSIEIDPALTKRSLEFQE